MLKVRLMGTKNDIKLIEKTGCRESTKLAKLNKWRMKVGREPINLITLKQSLK